MKASKTEDYSQDLNGLLKSDALKLYKNKGSVVIRPLGNEPNLNAYISVTSENSEEAHNQEKEITSDMGMKLI